MVRDAFQLRAADLGPVLRPTIRRNSPLQVFAYTELGKARSLECTVLDAEVFGDGEDDDLVVDIRESRLAAQVGLVAKRVGYGTRYFFRCPRSGEPVTSLIVIGDEIGSAASVGFRSTNQTRKQRILLDERSRLLDLTTRARGAPTIELIHQLWAVERKLDLPRTSFELPDQRTGEARPARSNRDLTKLTTTEGLKRCPYWLEPYKVSPWMGSHQERFRQTCAAEGPTPIRPMPPPLRPRPMEQARPFDLRALSDRKLMGLPDIIGFLVDASPSWATEGERRIGVLVDSEDPDNAFIGFLSWYGDMTDLQIIRLDCHLGRRGGQRWYMVCPNTGERRDCFYYAGGQFMPPSLAGLEYSSRLGKIR